MPRIFAIALPVGMKGSVQMATAGFPAFSIVIASCTLHELQDPQSPVDVIITSHFSRSSSFMCWGTGRPGFPLFSLTAPPRS